MRQQELHPILQCLNRAEIDKSEYNLTVLQSRLALDKQIINRDVSKLTLYGQWVLSCTKREHSGEWRSGNYVTRKWWMTLYLLPIWLIEDWLRIEIRVNPVQSRQLSSSENSNAPYHCRRRNFNSVVDYSYSERVHGCQHLKYPGLLKEGEIPMSRRTENNSCGMNITVNWYTFHWWILQHTLMNNLAKERNVWYVN